MAAHDVLGFGEVPENVEVLQALELVEQLASPLGRLPLGSGVVGVATVRTYIASILSKFDLDSKNELIGMPSPDFPEEAMARRDAQGPVAAVEKVPVQLSNVALGRVIRRLRKARSLTIGRLAREAGMSSAHLSTIEHGRCDTSLRTLVALTRVLEVPASTLVSEAEAETRSKKDPKVREKDGY